MQVSLLIEILSEDFLLSIIYYSIHKGFTIWEWIQGIYYFLNVKESMFTYRLVWVFFRKIVKQWGVFVNVRNLVFYSLIYHL